MTADDVLANHRMKIREIAEMVNISIERVENIRHVKLGEKAPLLLLYTH